MFSFSRGEWFGVNGSPQQMGGITMQSALGKFACLGGAVVLAATPALAEKARDLQFINGMNAAEGERNLFDRGFKHISSHRNSRGYVYSYWWDERDDKCVYVEVYERRQTVESIKDAKDQDCGHHMGSDAGTVAAVGVGAALLGALIGGSKSHHEDGNDYSSNDRAEFDRGYRDGLHHASYHNYSRSDAYSDGYQKGADERVANLNHHSNRHHRHGGYRQSAQFADLTNARAAGGMSTLEQRGFRQVDNFTSGNTRYSIQWQPETRQCVQVTIADGRFYNLQDIGNHPSCRGGGGSSSSMPAPAQYNDLVGRRGPRARETLGERGFTRVARFGDDSTRYSIMWRRASRQCLQLMIVDGRVADIRDIGTHPNCR